MNIHPAQEYTLKERREEECIQKGKQFQKADTLPVFVSVAASRRVVLLGPGKNYSSTRFDPPSPWFQEHQSTSTVVVVVAALPDLCVCFRSLAICVGVP